MIMLETVTLAILDTCEKENTIISKMSNTRRDHIIPDCREIKVLDGGKTVLLMSKICLDHWRKKQFITRKARDFAQTIMTAFRKETMTTRSSADFSTNEFWRHFWRNQSQPGPVPTFQTRILTQPGHFPTFHNEFWRHSWKKQSQPGQVPGFS